MDTNQRVARELSWQQELATMVRRQQHAEADASAAHAEADFLRDELSRWRRLASLAVFVATCAGLAVGLLVGWGTA